MPKYLLLLLFSLIVFSGSIFASWFGYTNLSFSDGTTTGKTLDVVLTVGTGASGFWIDVANPTQDFQSLKLDFVAQVQTPDGRSACDMISGKSFGENFLWDVSPFSVAGGTVERRRIDFNFPVCSSGIFLGCALQLDPNETSVGSFDVVAGKANFMSFLVSPSTACIPFSLKVYPGSRPSANFTNIGEIRFYNQSFVLQYSGSVLTNQFGTGTLQDSVPSGTYYVVYKGQSQLASYLSGVVISQGSSVVLDFTTGTNLYNTQNKSISQSDGSKYQVVGDLKNIIGQYDFMINGNDIAILTASGFIDVGVSLLDPKNLNADTAVNISDISIVGINFEQTDPYMSNNLFSW